MLLRNPCQKKCNKSFTRFTISTPVLEIGNALMPFHSASGVILNHIQAILQADRDSISVWIDRFNADGIAGLDDLPRSGRPLIYTSEDIAFFKAELDKEPRQIKQAQAKLQQQTAKTASKDTLKRALKKF
jgi:transposase